MALYAKQPAKVRMDVTYRPRTTHSVNREQSSVDEFLVLNRISRSHVPCRAPYLWFRIRSETQIAFVAEVAPSRSLHFRQIWKKQELVRAALDLAGFDAVGHCTIVGVNARLWSMSHSWKFDRLVRTEGVKLSTFSIVVVLYHIIHRVFILRSTVPSPWRSWL